MKLLTLMRGRGQHRAVDRVALLERRNSALEAELEATQTTLAAADALVNQQCERNAILNAANEALQTAHLTLAAQLNEAGWQLDTVTTAHNLLAEENDELAARYTELRQENNELRATPEPPPADDQPMARLRAYDPDATAENAMPLWDATGLPTFATAAGQAA